ncbi:hypothetical protein DBT_0354 [Dissulfuribacter thermophilus]|uniref:Uncharacterized protein n=1 Tax=Dissulfuribacter thermophilus TaxID=1156395 RepID=A0A1B9F9E0_9BACT|nr:hypothetical protein [Dissulfuribacter thermophilus]OCC16537.1 hypothetical protein DBT_0354 [Dissulfuribacter thermophilus]
MKGILFLIFWLGCASLHTVYDLKIKPYIQEKMDEWGEHPF